MKHWTLPELRAYALADERRRTEEEAIRREYRERVRLGWDEDEARRLLRRRLAALR